MACIDCDELKWLVEQVNVLLDRTCDCGCEFDQNNLVVNTVIATCIPQGGIADAVNALPGFTVEEDEIYIFQVTEDNGAGDCYSKDYIFKPGKGDYGSGQTAVTVNDFVTLTSLTEADIIEIINNNVTIPDGIEVVSVGTGDPLYQGPSGDDRQIASIKSIGDTGVDVYKGINAGDIEIRKIKSDVFEVVEDGDSVRINPLPAELITEFYVNNAYTGTEETGTSLQPFKTFDAAYDVYLGLGNGGTIDAPEFQGRTIRVLKGNGAYAYTKNQALNGLTINLEDGTVLSYVGPNYSIAWSNSVLSSLTGPGTTTSFTFEGAGTIISDRDTVLDIVGTGAIPGSGGGVSLFNINAKLDVESRYSNFGANLTTYAKPGGGNWQSNGVDINFYNGAFNKPAVTIRNINRASATLTNTDMLHIKSYTQPLLKVEGSPLISSTDNITLSKLGIYGVADHDTGVTDELLHNPDWYAIKIEGRARIDTKTLNVGNFGITLTENLFKLSNDGLSGNSYDATYLRITEGGEIQFDINATTYLKEAVNNEFLIDSADVTLFFVGLTDLTDTESQLIDYTDGATADYVPGFVNCIFSTAYANIGTDVDITDGGSQTRLNTFANQLTITGPLNNVTLNTAAINNSTLTNVGGSLSSPTLDFATFTNAAIFNGSIFQLNNLPTSLPGTADQLWNDGGTIKIS